MLERLPPKIHQIQKELPAWIQETGNAEAAALMQKLQEQLRDKNFEEVEKTADSILKLMGERPRGLHYPIPVHCPPPARAVACNCNLGSFRLKNHLN